MDIHLNGQEKEALSNALASAFTTYDSLKRMVTFKLDKKLETIVGKGALNTVITDLIELAESEGWLQALVEGASAANPQNPQLIAFRASIVASQPINPEKKTQ
jgi:Effector-associated domain 1